ncbi:MAG: hypothetical protein AAGD25_31115 [Cyanobacteria bacterium P01_F01_bin.150]
MTVSAQNRLHLQAETFTVEELIRQVKRGLIRVPDFQRPLRWESENDKPTCSVDVANAIGNKIS